jgi:hypothetical protein
MKMQYALCGLNNVTKPNKTITSPMMVVMPITAYHLLTIIYSQYFTFISVVALHLFYLITLLLNSHLYRAAAYAV